MKWIKDRLGIFLSGSFVKFAFVGVLNTLIGTFVMFLCYRAFGLGYWISSAMNYVAGSVFSYFANKHFTFRSKNKSRKEIVLFALNIIVCYLVSYGCAKPLVRFILSNFFVLKQSLLEEAAMLVGMVLFVLLNYFGQKHIVFKIHETSD